MRRRGTGFEGCAEKKIRARFFFSAQLSKKRYQYPMLFVSYAQPLSLAAHTAGAALIEYFNGKEGTLKAEQTSCEALFYEYKPRKETCSYLLSFVSAQPSNTFENKSIVKDYNQALIFFSLHV